MDLATSIKQSNYFCRHCGLHQIDNLFHQCKSCGHPIEPRFDKNEKPVKFDKME